jgi:hypothetical protein
LPALYSPKGKVTDLRNPIPADYNSRIRKGYNIYPNRLGFLDRQVVFACSVRFAEQSGDPCDPFWRVGPPCLVRPMWSHEGIRVYTPTLSFPSFSRARSLSRSPPQPVLRLRGCPPPTRRSLASDRDLVRRPYLCPCLPFLSLSLSRRGNIAYALKRGRLQRLGRSTTQCAVSHQSFL